jgi:hypothetical protein
MKARAFVLCAALGGLLTALEGAQATSGGPVGEAPASVSAPSPSELTRLNKAASRGDAQAQYDLAVVLDCGRGAKRDPARALRWLTQAASGGHVAAQSALGWKYMTGEGVVRDDGTAFRWIRRAAESGEAAAQNNLGILYAQGRGVEADVVEAEKWFRRAAEQGAADAQRNLDELLAGRSRATPPSGSRPLDRT